jgi:hypothetical protein
MCVLLLLPYGLNRARAIHFFSTPDHFHVAFVCESMASTVGLCEWCAMKCLFRTLGTWARQCIKSQEGNPKQIRITNEQRQARTSEGVLVSLLWHGNCALQQCGAARHTTSGRRASLQGGGINQGSKTSFHEGVHHEKLGSVASAEWRAARAVPSRNGKREIPLPPGTDPDKIAASSSKGVITVTIPQKPEAQPKKIAVKAQD